MEDELYRARLKIKDMRELLKEVRETLRWNLAAWVRKDEVRMYNDVLKIDKLLKKRYK